MNTKDCGCIEMMRKIAKLDNAGDDMLGFPSMDPPGDSEALDEDEPNDYDDDDDYDDSDLEDDEEDLV